MPRWLFNLGISVWLSVLLGPARAETDSPAILPTLTVTATKSERAVESLPESVSVVTRAQFERFQPSDLGGVLEGLPNVAVGGGPRGIGQQITVRGLSDERLLLLLDGARQDFGRAHNAPLFIDPELLRQVDVVRGPASALWGSGALGGVIALETLDGTELLAPGQSLGARVKTGYQDGNGQWLGSATVYGVNDHGLDALLSLTGREASNMRLGDGSDLAHSGFRELSGLGKVNWSPDGRNRFGVSVLAGDIDGEVPSNPQTEATEDNLVDRTTRQSHVALRYTREEPLHTWLQPSLLLYRNHTDIDERRLFDRRHDQTDFETLGLDLRNRAVLGGDGPWSQVLTMGLDAYRNRAEAERDGKARDSYPDGRTEVVGFYLQDEIRLGERWTLIPGLRWDNYRSETDAADIADNEDSALSMKFSVHFALTDWLSLQALYNEAFRAPSISELFVSGVHFTCGPGCENLFIPNPSLKPEKAYNKELGLRLHRDGLLTPGDRGDLRVAMFRNDVDDFIDQIVDFSMHPVPGNLGRGGVTGFVNVGSAQLEGFEVEARYQAPRWFATASYGQTRGEDRHTGEPLSAIEPDQWTLQAGMQMPQRDIDFGARARLVAAQNRVPASGTPSDAYQLYDLWLSWNPASRQGQGPSLNLAVDNLLDEDYQPYLSALQGPGRNIKLMLAYRF
ncbi:TonB-dependent hemoglobin/transferrin/lactoferrin family receptor [Rhabdochromatium marinum]|uniref:TonB-dependent hemoglobin/transferrin/lactoferrin family receptor n=1 Tax=Rhabdochromatium marinum TaxID=48729 RepID=UPI001903B357|nr:TonB-dependent hemoglobin/transferrin/lactoferrin family receptor [Rhabdochromatium marinum]MBK1648024.1 TonB-dependent receptor [Rhabdochromatium marinum]